MQNIQREQAKSRRNNAHMLRRRDSSNMGKKNTKTTGANLPFQALMASKKKAQTLRNLQGRVCWQINKTI